MALADILTQSALQTSTQVPDIAGSLSRGIQQGAQLAEQVENIQMARAKHEEMKQQAELAKFAKVGAMYEAKAKIPDPRTKRAFQSYIDKTMSALSIADKVDPTVQEMIAGSDNLGAFLADKIRNGEMRYADLMDPAKIAEISSGLKRFGDQQVLEQTREDFAPQLEEAAKFAATQEGKTERAGLLAGQAKQKNIREDIDNLRKEFTANPISKETKDINSAYDRIASAFGEAPSAAGDISGLIAYMKMLDPGSTVREGEFATAQNAAGVPDRIRAMFNKTISGERLTPEQRADFLDQAAKIKTRQESRQEQLTQQYSEIARSRGYNPKDIFAGVDIRKTPLKKAVPKFKDVTPEAREQFKSLTPAQQDKVVKAMAEGRGKSIEEMRKELEGK